MQHQGETIHREACTALCTLVFCNICNIIPYEGHHQQEQGTTNRGGSEVIDTGKEGRHSWATCIRAKMAGCQLREAAQCYAQQLCPAHLLGRILVVGGGCVGLSHSGQLRNGPFPPLPSPGTCALSQLQPTMVRAAARAASVLPAGVAARVVPAALT